MKRYLGVDLHRNAKTRAPHAAFTVPQKTFAYFLNNHHGDSIVSVAPRRCPVKTKRSWAAHPRRFYLLAYIGPRGWLGLRLDCGKIDWGEVRDLVAALYLQVASKRLAPA